MAGPLPDEGVLRDAASAASSGGAANKDASTRTSVASLPGIELLEHDQAVEDLVRALERRRIAYPLRSVAGVRRWRAIAGQTAIGLALAARQDGRVVSWDLREVVGGAESVAKAEAEEVERQRAEVEAADRRQAEVALVGKREAEQARARREAEDRATGQRWLAVAEGLQLPTVTDAQVTFRDDLDHAERALAMRKRELAESEERLRRRRRGQCLSVGVGLGAGVIAGRALRDPSQPFSWGAFFGVGLSAGLIASSFAETLVEDAGEIARGASIVTGLGRLAS